MNQLRQQGVDQGREEAQERLRPSSCFLARKNSIDLICVADMYRIRILS
jgi:hypothetical protein